MESIAGFSKDSFALLLMVACIGAVVGLFSMTIGACTTHAEEPTMPSIGPDGY